MAGLGMDLCNSCHILAVRLMQRDADKGSVLEVKGGGVRLMQWDAV